MSIHSNSEHLPWPWPWSQQSIKPFHKTIQLKMMCHQSKFSCRRISSSEDILESHILIIWLLTVALTLKTANQAFWMTIWLMMMHCHTKFGSKRFSSSEDNIWTNIHKHLELCCELDLECSNPFFFHMTFWLVMAYHHSKSGCQRISSSEDTVERVIF